MNTKTKRFLTIVFALLLAVASDTGITRTRAALAATITIVEDIQLTYTLEAIARTEMFSRQA